MQITKKRFSLPRCHLNLIGLHSIRLLACANSLGGTETIQLLAQLIEHCIGVFAKVLFLRPAIHKIQIFLDLRVPTYAKHVVLNWSNVVSV
jgi:hypothetical protein